MSRVRFTSARVAAMCKWLGSSLPHLRRAVLAVGRAGLHADYAESWNRRNPFYGYCYRVCETIVRAGKVPSGFQLHRKAIRGETHYFFISPDSGEILDPTAQQFRRKGYDYRGSRRVGLLPQVSQGARALAQELGWQLKRKKSQNSSR